MHGHMNEIFAEVGGTVAYLSNSSKYPYYLAI